jgi:hypothetical protein
MKRRTRLSVGCKMTVLFTFRMVLAFFHISSFPVFERGAFPGELRRMVTLLHLTTILDVSRPLVLTLSVKIVMVQ